MDFLYIFGGSDKEWEVCKIENKVNEVRVLMDWVLFKWILLILGRINYIWLGSVGGGREK